MSVRVLVMQEPIFPVRTRALARWGRVRAPHTGAGKTCYVSLFNSALGLLTSRRALTAAAVALAAATLAAAALAKA